MKIKRGVRMFEAGIYFGSGVVSVVAVFVRL
jgi:hypothetical protein